MDTKWQQIFDEEAKKPYFIELCAFVKKERESGKKVYPPERLVFNAFMKTPYDKVKVVIVGQDPYHGAGQAHGLSFSVLPGIPLPPSLKNIYKELCEDVGCAMPSHGCLEKWAEQGVLLLNVTLTVEEKEPLSHHNRGWERFTDACIQALALRDDPIIFVLWGKKALDKCMRVPELHNRGHHTILTAAHPSPFSAHSGFFGCKHFSKINQILIERGQAPIDWQP